MTTRDRLVVIGRRARLLRALVRTCALALGLAACGGPGESGPAPVTHREVAVTFDDLPVVSVTPLDAAGRRDLTRRLLARLRATGVPAIGFVNEYGLHGLRREPGDTPDPEGVALLEMWLDAGLELGNHTFAHTDLHETSLPAFEEDVIRGEVVTAALLEKKAMRPRYFRHPYLHTGRELATKRALERFLAARGYRVAPVTVDNEDYLFAAAYSRAAARGDGPLMRRVATEYIRYTERAFEYSERLAVALFGREIKQVVLLHANALNADCFDELARMMRRRGYSFVSLEAALRDEAYGSDDTYTGKESINWLARWAVTRGERNADNVLDDFPDVPKFVVDASGT
jgi:peptidoglycan/xylan/chitin deacetylase (PgdA/CDA1 family)